MTNNYLFIGIQVTINHYICLSHKSIIYKEKALLEQHFQSTLLIKVVVHTFIGNDFYFWGMTWDMVFPFTKARKIPDVDRRRSVPDAIGNLFSSEYWNLAPQVDDSGFSDGKNSNKVM